MTVNQNPASLLAQGFKTAGKLVDGEVPIYRIDSAPSNVAQLTQMRSDSLFPASSMVELSRQVSEMPLAPTTAQTAFEIDSTAGWADAVEHHSMAHFGHAAKICCAADFPSVSLSGKSVRTPSTVFGTSINLCYADIQRGNRAGMDVAVRSMAAVRQVLAEKLNMLAWLGSTPDQIMGVANNPLIGQANSAVRLDDPMADPFLVLDILNKAARQPSINSGLALAKPNTVVVSPTVVGTLASRLLGPFQSMTIWEMFLKQTGITKVVEEPMMDCLPGNQRTTLFYNRARSETVWHLPIIMDILPARDNGYGVDIPVICRVNSVWFSKPQSVVKLVG